MMDGQAERIVRRLSAMEGTRNPYEARWRECFDVTWPERGDSFWNRQGVPTDEQAKRARLVDSTTADAAETLAAGLVGGLVPSNLQWFDLDTGDVDAVEHNDWLSEQARFLWSNIHASNFDACAMDVFIDAVAAGWFCLYVEERAGGGFDFQWWPLGECYIAASRAGGPIDTVYRRYALTVEQCVSMFGYAGVSERTRGLFDKGGASLEDKVEMVHAIEPRRNAPGGPFARDLPVASYHIELTDKHMCRESGYHEFPCAVPRWRLINGQPYALGPVAKVLPDANTLNALGTTEIQAAELAVGGLWKGRDDGVLNPHNVRIGPRRVIVVADMQNFERLDTSNGRGAQQGWTLKADLQASIRKALMTDYLQPQDKPQMTAYEVHVRVQMIRQLLGPNFGRFQSEFLQPLIARCFGIAMRAGALGEPPEGLDRYSVQYKSPLARAQQAEDAEATAGYIDWLGNLATVKQDASVFDGIDLDKAGRHIATGRGVPTDVLRDPDEVADLRKRREEAAQDAEQQQAQQEVQMMAAEGAAKRVAAGA